MIKKLQALKDKKGFTLVERVVVIDIIGLLAAILVPTLIGVIQDSCETALNSSSDVLLTATAEFMQWRKAGKELPF